MLVREENNPLYFARAIELGGSLDAAECTMTTADMTRLLQRGGSLISLVGPSSELHFLLLDKVYGQQVHGVGYSGVSMAEAAAAIANEDAIKYGEPYYLEDPARPNLKQVCDLAGITPGSVQRTRNKKSQVRRSWRDSKLLRG